MRESCNLFLFIGLFFLIQEKAAVVVGSRAHMQADAVAEVTCNIDTITCMYMYY